MAVQPAYWSKFLAHIRAHGRPEKAAGEQPGDDEHPLRRGMNEGDQTDPERQLTAWETPETLGLLT